MQTVEPLVRVDAPPGATHFQNNLFYKVGRFGLVYRYDHDLRQWMRSYLDRRELKTSREIKHDG